MTQLLDDDSDQASPGNPPPLGPTAPIDTLRNSQPKRRIGRPPGSRDSKPRVVRRMSRNATAREGQVPRVKAGRAAVIAVAAKHSESGDRISDRPHVEICPDGSGAGVVIGDSCSELASFAVSVEPGAAVAGGAGLKAGGPAEGHAASFQSTEDGSLGRDVGEDDDLLRRSFPFYLAEGL